MSNAPAIMYAAFNHFNRALFGGRLSACPLEVGDTGSAQATCHPDKIVFSSREPLPGSVSNCLVLTHEMTHRDVGLHHQHDAVFRRRTGEHGLVFNEAGIERPVRGGKFYEACLEFMREHGLDIDGNPAPRSPAPAPQPAQNTGCTAVILDCSDSMIGDNEARRRRAVQAVVDASPNVKIIAFRQRAEIISSLDEIPRIMAAQPAANDLAAALRLASSLKPARAVVITDAGVDIYDIPWGAQHRAAGQLGCPIDAVWLPEPDAQWAIEGGYKLAKCRDGRPCGERDPHEYMRRAAEFMRQLACNGGQFHDGSFVGSISAGLGQHGDDIIAEAFESRRLPPDEPMGSVMADGDPSPLHPSGSGNIGRFDQLTAGGSGMSETRGRNLAIGNIDQLEDAAQELARYRQESNASLARSAETQRRQDADGTEWRAGGNRAAPAQRGFDRRTGGENRRTA
jgi:hypothetical protein